MIHENVYQRIPSGCKSGSNEHAWNLEQLAEGRKHLTVLAASANMDSCRFTTEELFMNSRACEFFFGQACDGNLKKFYRKFEGVGTIAAVVHNFREDYV